MRYEYNKKELYECDSEGNYPIHLICRSDCGDSGGKISDLRRLFKVDPSFDVDISNGFNQTGLHLACRAGKPALVDFLLEKDAYIEARDIHNRTPIYSAIAGSNKSVEILCKAGANLDHVDGERCTPIMLAVKLGKVGAIQILCKFKFDMKISDSSEKSMISMVIDSRTSWSYSNLEAMVRSLLKKGVKVNRQDLDTGRNEVLKLAIAMDKERLGYGEKQRLKILSILIAAGCNPWTRDYSGETTFNYLKDSHLEILSKSLKKYLKNNVNFAISKIESILEYKAFYSNQSKHTEREIYQMLLDGTEAKKYLGERMPL